MSQNMEHVLNMLPQPVHYMGHAYSMEDECKLYCETNESS